MAGFNNFYNPNQTMINQLMRQKDNIDNLLNQYSQPQPPVQNIINTMTGTEFEARILKDDEELENIYINKRTMFLDKKNKRLVVKELDGKISEQYDVILPKDEKDLRIEELEKRLKDMEVRMNYEHTEPIKSNDECQKSIADGVEPIKSTAKAISKSITRTAE